MNNPSKPNHISPDLMQQFLNTQNKEIELRTQELVLRKQADNNSFEYGKASLAATERDRTAERKHRSGMFQSVLIFISLVTLVVVAFLAYALWLNKDNIALEVIKAIILVMVSGGGGYAMGSKKSAENANTQN